jgi:hypothetical protein
MHGTALVVFQIAEIVTAKQYVLVPTVSNIERLCPPETAPTRAHVLIGSSPFQLYDHRCASRKADTVDFDSPPPLTMTLILHHGCLKIGTSLESCRRGFTVLVHFWHLDAGELESDTFSVDCRLEPAIIT